MLQYSSPRSTYLFPNEVPNWRQEQDATITDSLEVAVGFLLIGYNNVFCVVVENSQFSFFTILPYHGSHRHWSPSLGGSCVPHTSRPKLLFLKYMGAETVSNAVVSKYADWIRVLPNDRFSSVFPLPTLLAGLAQLSGCDICYKIDVPGPSRQQIS
ncbi:hypothetical protein DTO012A8_10087 [Penicillium roqueforti]|nr:hypothetical protein DTO012A8_10087 [Penicillium roqueforti]